MKILFCNYEYPPLSGGGGVVNAALAEELAKRHEITVLTSHGLDLPRQTFERGVRIIRVPVFFRKAQAVANFVSMFAYMAMGIQAGKRLLQRESFDVINTHFVLPSGPVGDTLARYGRIPNVLSVHGGDLYDPSKFTSPHRHFVLRQWVRWLLRRADRVVGQSTNTLQNVNEFYDPILPSIRIPLGIPKPDVTPVPRKDFGLSDQDILLITVGRLVPRKGLSQLISLAEHFKGTAVRLLILGSGPEETILKEAIRTKGLDRQVLLMGQVQEHEKFQLLTMSDLYVSTSQHEGFGLVFLEAMACGLPVICYDFGGQTDFLKNDHSGYLIPLNDLDAFRQHCEALIHEPDRRKSMGAYNSRLVKDFFVDQCAKRYEAVFAQVMGHGAAGGPGQPVGRLSEDMVEVC